MHTSTQLYIPPDFCYQETYMVKAELSPSMDEVTLPGGSPKN